VMDMRRGGYQPARLAEANAELRDVLDLIASGSLTNGDAEVLRPVAENLLQADPFLVLADYAAYVACQQRVGEVWSDPPRWTRMSILNSARSGRFSSDRAVREYCEDIWDVPPVGIELD